MGHVFNSMSDDNPPVDGTGRALAGAVDAAMAGAGVNEGTGRDLSEQRLRALLETTSDWIWEVDAEARYTYASTKVHDLLGYEPQEVIGKTPFDFMPPDEAKRLTPVLASIVAARKAFSCLENTNLHRDGHAVVLESSGVPVFGPDGILQGYRGVDRDITRRKAAEEAVQRAMQAAERASRAKDHFLAALSHELRTPLTPILSTVDLLEQTPLPAGMQEHFSVIRRNVEMEARLVDDLLDLNRISQGKVELHLTLLNAHAELEHVRRMCQGEFQAKQIQVVVHENAPNPWVQADVIRFHQVVWNILRNAIKFTPAGGTITLSTANPSPADLTLTCTDTGVGIDAEAMPRIFNAFEQGSADITREFGGLGLGLAITRSMVELHGGRVTAQSAGRGKGATFQLDFPTAQAPAASEAAVPLPVKPRRTSHRILLVDDHADTLAAMARLLARRGHSVRTASTVAEAVQLAAAEPLDLIICDIGLPDGSGRDVLRQLHDHRPIKAIALSGYGMETDIKRSLEAGFDLHLTKPLSFDRLVKHIQEVMDNSTSGRSCP